MAEPKSQKQSRKMINQDDYERKNQDFIRDRGNFSSQ